MIALCTLELLKPSVKIISLDVAFKVNMDGTRGYFLVHPALRTASERLKNGDTGRSGATTADDTPLSSNKPRAAAVQPFPQTWAAAREEGIVSPAQAATEGAALGLQQACDLCRMPEHKGQ